MRVLLFVCIVISFTVSTYADEFWEKINIPDKGPVLDVTYKNGLWLAGSAGVYYTDNIDGRWEISSKLNYQGMELDMATAPVALRQFAIINDDYWYACGGEDYLMRTTNHGYSWEMAEIEGFEMNNIFKLAFTDDGVFYLATFDSYYVSYDTCRTMIPIDLEGADSYSTGDITICPDGTVCLPCSESILIKKPTDETFTRYDYDGEIEGIRFISISKKDGSFVVFSKKDGVYTIDEESGTIEFMAAYPEIDYYNVNNAYAAADGKMYLVDSGAELMFSNDNGSSWSTISDKIEGDVKSIRYFDGKLIACANGLFVSEDGGESWEKKNKGMNMGGLYYGAVDGQGNIFMLFEDTMYRLMDGAAEPEMISIDSFDVEFLLACRFFDVNQNGDLFYYNFHDDVLYKSTDKGDSWTDLSSNIELLFSIKITKDGVIYGHNIYDDLLYISDNEGVNWTETEVPECSMIYECMAHRGGDVMIRHNGGVAYSRDYGENWTSLVNEPPYIDEYDGPTAFAIIGDTLFVFVEYEGLYYTTDDGENWGLIDDEVETIFDSDIPNVEKILISGDRLYSSYYGIISIGPGETEWADENKGGQFGQVNWFDLGADGRAYIINIKGMFRSTSPITTVDEQGRFESESISGRIYPNPVGDICHLELAEHGDETITTIYDISGKEIIAPVQWPAGQQVIDINVSSLNPGQYFLRIEAGDKSGAVILQKK